ncbi:MAG: serine/threonine protein kinase [Myxococcales bacterium]|nr:serine/threonine protein kinase [Myxococcales bacterium]
MHLSPITPTSRAGLTPEVLGRHRLLFHIGRGGMADVYLAAALGPSGFHKEVVVKALRPELAESEDFLEMFMDEARLAARMRHPNVVQTLEVSREDGVHYMVLEYYEGQTLDRLMRRREGEGLPLGIALHIAREVTSALDYAHTLVDMQGQPMRVVHRDVSPQNIMIGYEGRVRLLDFGVAKASTHTSETRAGDFKGKIAYMAPEQAAGTPVDARTDLYALGVVLFELVSGQRMWGGVPDASVAARLLAGKLPIATFDENVPASVRPLLSRLMAHDPQNRFESAAAARAAIEALIEQLGAHVDDRQLSGLMLATFAEERDALREAVRTRMARLSTGESLPPSLVRGAVFGQPTVATDTALTAVTRTDHLGAQALRTGASAPPRRAFPVWATLLALALVLGVALFAIDRYATPPAAAPDVASSPEGEGASSGAQGALVGAGGGTGSRAMPEFRCDDPERPVVQLTGEIETSATLRCNRRYLLRHNTFVNPGVTLTIEAGTLILGDSETRGTLVVLPGARIVAEGTATAPIVFTSDKPEGQRRAGDWGGVIVLGRASINARDVNGAPISGRIEGLEQVGEEAAYGGQRDDDSSGVISYVRIEYPGVEIAPNNEINGLTLAGVGRETRVDHVHVYRPLDDCFEFFGGTVDARYLVCDSPGDDAFDWDQGYRGRLQFLLMRGTPDASLGSNGFEGDGDPNGLGSEPRSAPTIFNATLCGGGGSGDGSSHGVFARRATLGLLRNVLASGFHIGVEARGDATGVDLGGIGIFGISRYDVASGTRYDPPEVGQPIDCASGRVAPTEPVLETAEAPPQDGFFDARARYLGAFRDVRDTWHQGWTRSLAEPD